MIKPFQKYLHLAIVTCIIMLCISCSKTVVERIVGELEFQDRNQLNTGAIISKYEVTNAQFRKFLSVKDNEKYRYDSTRWLIVDISDPMIRSYHSHPAFDNYPIVNISFEAASKFCNWLTDHYSQEDDISFRLPTVSEFSELIVQRRNLECSSCYNEMIFGCSNLKYTNKEGIVNFDLDGTLLTANVTAYNQLGICSIIGNVSEIMAEGVYMGGNWDAFYSEVNETFKHELPDPRVGFRVVMIKKER